MECAAIIPCRSGSKGIPNKNFKDLCGKPLWKWSLDEAKKSKVFSLIIVSSDGGLGQSGMVEGGVFFHDERDESHSNDQAQLDPLIQHYSNYFKGVDAWCLLQPTSPLRTWADIRGAYLKFQEGYDSVISITSMGDKFWKRIDTNCCEAQYDFSNRLNRQDPKTNILYYENGSIYFCTSKQIKRGCRIGGKIGLYVIPQYRSYQIDTPTDWVICETILKRQSSLETSE